MYKRQGKSFAAKGEIENIILSSNADVIIIDPEREYSQLVKALGGEIINISATSPSHINAMDMNKEYGDGANPVILKSEFIMSLCEQLIGGTNLGAKQKSIIDRCTASVYRDYQQRGYTLSLIHILTSWYLSFTHSFFSSCFMLPTIFTEARFPFPFIS